LARMPSARWPFILNTGRVRDQWHTMTRTGLSARLAAHSPEPFVEINPDDAQARGLKQGHVARVATEHGSAVLKVRLSPGQQRGSLSVPIHWSDANSSSGRIGALVQAITDPISGQPEAKSTPASIRALGASHYGVLLSRAPVDIPAALYWARARTRSGY